MEVFSRLEHGYSDIAMATSLQNPDDMRGGNHALPYGW